MSLSPALISAWKKSLPDPDSIKRKNFKDLLSAANKGLAWTSVAGLPMVDLKLPKTMVFPKMDLKLYCTVATHVLNKEVITFWIPAEFIFWRGCCSFISPACPPKYSKFFSHCSLSHSPFYSEMRVDFSDIPSSPTFPMSLISPDFSHA